MLNPTRFENTRPDGFPCLALVEPAGAGFVPLKHSELTGNVAGPFVELTLTQRFSFSRSAYDRPIEALYRFPLPGDAAVLGVRVRFGEVELDATLHERAAAEAHYESAKSEGRQAALVTRESPDVFTLRVAGILPDQDVEVQTRFIQLASPEDKGQWSLRLPLTTAPRYVRADEVGSPHARGNPLLVVRDPGHRFSLALTIQGAAQVSAPSHHPVVTVRESGALDVCLENVLPDRDLVLLWRASAPEQAVGLTVFTAGEYYLAQVAPPLQVPETVLPREVILLVDHSGSMEGAKWKAANWAVVRFLSELTPQDRFALGVFHSSTRWLSTSLRPGTAEAVREATRFLAKSQDSGGTELGVALEQALSLSRMPGDKLARHVLIVTDAEVSDAGRLLNLVGAEAKLKQRRRVSVLCIDAAPNSYLACQLAERGGGVARFLTSDPEQDDITGALDALLAQWSAPLHTGLSLRAGTISQDLGELSVGRARWIAGRLPKPEAEFVLESEGATLASVQALPGPESLKALIGVRRINALEYLLTGRHNPAEILATLRELGYPELVVSRTLYPENEAKLPADHVRKLLLEESLAYGIVSSVTGFVATRKERGEVVAVTVPVANALPKAWGESACISAFDVSGFSDVMFARSLALPQPQSRSAGKTSWIQRLFGGAPPQDDAVGEPDAAGIYDLDEETGEASQATLAFSGVPFFKDDRALLFEGHLPGVLLTLLSVRYPQGALGKMDSGLILLLYMDDLTTPRVSVRLAELERLGGERPLNLKRGQSDLVRVVLIDENGAWKQGAPSLELRLG